jgi:hypothetical protein
MDSTSPIFVQKRDNEITSLWKVELFLDTDPDDTDPNASRQNATDPQPITALLVEGGDSDISDRFRRGCALHIFRRESANRSDTGEADELSTLLDKGHDHGTVVKLHATFICPIRMYKIDTASISRGENQPTIFDVRPVKPPFDIALECGKLFISPCSSTSTVRNIVAMGSLTHDKI